MRQTSEHAADQVKYQITKVAHAIFDVIAEDEKKEHVAEDVRDASMHEHGRDQREIDWNRRRLEARHFETLPRDRLHHNPIARRDVFARNDLRRDGRKSVGEFFVRAEALEKYEDQHIDENEQIIDDRRSPATYIFISDWKKHSFSSSILVRIGVLTSYIRPMLSSHRECQFHLTRNHI